MIDSFGKRESRLLDARQDEIRAIVFGGKEIRPIDAAKRVKQGVGFERLDSEPGTIWEKPRHFLTRKLSLFTKQTPVSASKTNEN